MSNAAYPLDRTAYLLVDPYNDFLSEGGKIFPLLEPIALVQSFYRMVNALAVARGYDPDRPPHLNKVTETV